MNDNKITVKVIQGEKGEKGEKGENILTGDEDPNDGLGVDGQVYINISSGDVFKKQNGTWL